MCLEFGSCFGGRRRDDYGRRRRNANWSAPAYPQPPTVIVHEAGHKAYHDGTPKAEHADAGSHGGCAYFQDKAGSETPSKLPAWQDKVGDDAGYGAYTYTPRHHEAAVDHREHAAMDHHQYPTTSATLVRT
uniref:Uncharacterized protein n=1 Tax=Aegilops tauschii TaxID=37682 RepID=M8C827_AEGTA